jgi:small subunit ribosomal protein S1
MDPTNETPDTPSAAPAAQPSEGRGAGALDADLAREIEEALGGLSLDDMVQRTTAPQRPVPVKGERSMRAGKVMRVHDGDVFIEFDPKRHGVCPIGQFETEPQPGEVFDFFEERFDPFEQLWVVSRRGATVKADWNNLSEGMIVEARCIGMNKGGLDMEVAHHKAFMPASQVDLRALPDISVFLGEKFPCKIIEIRKEKGRMVLSRKAALLEERSRLRAKVLEELEVGQTRTATITSIQQYGAFADLGGVDGLIHIGDLTHERIKDPGQVVKVGDVVEVRVLKIDRNAKPIKISLGRKQTLSDPAIAAMGEIQEGSEVTGTVTRLTDFGAFVELSPGVEGLIHVSEVAHERIPTPAKVLRVGEVVQCKVLGVDQGRKRISLSRKALIDRPAPPQHGRDARQGAPAVPLREDDPSMRKLRAKFAGVKRELKGGLG